HGTSLPWPDRGRTVVSFLAQQLRLVAPALLFAAVLLVHRGEPARSAPSNDGAASLARRRAAWIGLVAVPLVLTVAVAPLFGLKLQNHWGYQSLQFASLFVADRLRRRVPADIAGWIAIAVLIHGVFLAVAVQTSRQASADQRAEAGFPARALAAAVMRDWNASTPC